MPFSFDEFYVAADHADLLKEAVWNPSDGSDSVSAKVDFRAADETMPDGLSLFGILTPPIFGVMASVKTAKKGALTDIKNACFLPQAIYKTALFPTL